MSIAVRLTTLAACCALALGALAGTALAEEGDAPAAAASAPAESAPDAPPAGEAVAGGCPGKAEGGCCAGCQAKARLAARAGTTVSDDTGGCPCQRARRLQQEGQPDQ